MDTPVLDFLRAYEKSGAARFHMPGHKGRGPLGCEGWDITEIKGADFLYEASGIIARSEENAAALFGAGRTLYATGGSSQCVGAMLYLALTCRAPEAAPVVLAARNVHKSFVHAAGLLGLEAEWLWPEAEESSLCACPVTAAALEAALAGREKPPAAVYITSPDYLGNTADIAALADTAHRYGAPLLVDNAHGAYLRFLDASRHPMDLGADLCCDSAHKTLPVLTGGAYLHIGENAPPAMKDGAGTAMALFGSTSPSYLILASLDGCNAALAGAEPERIRAAASRLDGLKAALVQKGWTLAGDEPLKLTIDAAASGWDGGALAEALRGGGVEPEYADGEYVTLMVSGATTEGEPRRLAAALGKNDRAPIPRPGLSPARGERAMSIRQALLAPHETVAADAALGRVCAAPAVSCPPAVPIAVSGEIIGPEAIALFRHYNIERVEVTR